MTRRDYQQIHLLLGPEEADCVLLHIAPKMHNILDALTHNHHLFGGNRVDGCSAPPLGICFREKVHL